MEKENCPCKKERCIRHGGCELCRAHHAETGKLTACARIKKRRERALTRAAERTGSRNKNG